MFTKLVGHTNKVTSLALLANGYLASGGKDSVINIWDPIYGKLVRTINQENVQSLASLSNGNLASCSFNENTIKIWDTSNGKLLRTIISRKGEVICLVLLSNGHLASSNYDKTIKIWDTSNGKLLRTIKGPIDIFSSLVLLSDGHLACGSDEKTIKIWDPINGRLVRILKLYKRNIGSVYGIESLSLLANGLLAASIGIYIFIWDPFNGRHLRTLMHTDYVSSLVSLPNGYLVSSSYDGSIKLWEPNNGELLKTLYQDNNKERSSSVLAVLSNGQLVSSGEEPDNSIKIWNMSATMVEPELNTFGERLLKSVCPICLVKIHNTRDIQIIITKCGHMFCESCLRYDDEDIDEQECPYCRENRFFEDDQYSSVVFP